MFHGTKHRLMNFFTKLKPILAAPTSTTSSIVTALPSYHDSPAQASLASILRRYDIQHGVQYSVIVADSVEPVDVEVEDSENNWLVAEALAALKPDALQFVLAGGTSSTLVIEPNLAAAVDEESRIVDATVDDYDSSWLEALSSLRTDVIQSVLYGGAAGITDAESGFIGATNRQAEDCRVASDLAEEMIRELIVSAEDLDQLAVPEQAFYRLLFPHEVGDNTFRIESRSQRRDFSNDSLATLVEDDGKDQTDETRSQTNVLKSSSIRKAFERLPIEDGKADEAAALKAQIAELHAAAAQKDAAHVTALAARDADRAAAITMCNSTWESLLLHSVEVKEAELAAQKADYDEKLSTQQANHEEELAKTKSDHEDLVRAKEASIHWLINENSGYQSQLNRVWCTYIHNKRLREQYARVEAYAQNEAKMALDAIADRDDARRALEEKNEELADLKETIAKKTVASNANFRVYQTILHEKDEEHAQEVALFKDAHEDELQRKADELENAQAEIQQLRMEKSMDPEAVHGETQRADDACERAENLARINRRITGENIYLSDQASDINRHLLFYRDEIIDHLEANPKLKAEIAQLRDLLSEIEKNFSKDKWGLQRELAIANIEKRQLEEDAGAKMTEFVTANEVFAAENLKLQGTVQSQQEILAWQENVIERKDNENNQALYDLYQSSVETSNLDRDLKTARSVAQQLTGDNQDLRMKDIQKDQKIAELGNQVSEFANLAYILGQEKQALEDESAEDKRAITGLRQENISQSHTISQIQQDNTTLEGLYNGSLQQIGDLIREKNQLRCNAVLSPPPAPEGAVDSTLAPEPFGAVEEHKSPVQPSTPLYPPGLGWEVFYGAQVPSTAPYLNENGSSAAPVSTQVEEYPGDVQEPAEVGSHEVSFEFPQEIPAHTLFLGSGNTSEFDAPIPPMVPSATPRFTFEAQVAPGTFTFGQQLPSHKEVIATEVPVVAPFSFTYPGFEPPSGDLQDNSTFSLGAGQLDATTRDHLVRQAVLSNAFAFDFATQAASPNFSFGQQAVDVPTDSEAEVALPVVPSLLGHPDEPAQDDSTHSVMPRIDNKESFDFSTPPVAPPNATPFSFGNQVKPTTNENTTLNFEAQVNPIPKSNASFTFGSRAFSTDFAFESPAARVSLEAPQNPAPSGPKTFSFEALNTPASSAAPENLATPEVPSQKEGETKTEEELKKEKKRAQKKEQKARRKAEKRAEKAEAQGTTASP